MRYAASGVEAVINFVVKQPTAGVNGGLSSANAVSTGFGNNIFYVQANHKRSTFGLQYFVTYRNYDERTMDETQTFNFADGSVRRRVSEGLNTPFSYTTHALAATYNLTEVDGQPMFVYAAANQKRSSRLGGQLSVNVKLVPDVLSLNLYGGVNRYDSRGHDYSHRYTAWNGGGSLSATYKGFSFYASMSSRYNALYGETIDYGETNSVLQLMYTWKTLSAGLGMLYPFQARGWSGGSRQMNRLVQKESWSHIRDNGNMVLLQLTWRFSRGRKHQAGRKELSNSDHETGIATE